MERPSFDEVLERIEKERKSYEAKEKLRPRREFLSEAEKSGFTEQQALFMWNWLAKADHQHWNGMVG